MVDPIADKEGDAPKPQLSIFRVLIAVVLAVAVVVGAGAAIDHSVRVSAGQRPGTTWFAPYVDTTLTPVTSFQDPASNPSRQVVLGFVVADSQHACSPSWGSYYSLDQASQSINLDARVAQVRSQGGNVIASFGGMANSELAVSCTDATQLTAAYRSVVSRYDLTTIDVDVEGAALADTAATARRGLALAALQKAGRASGKPLTVWLTLPVAPNGLTPEALDAVAGTLRAGVNIGGINVMAMDFGVPEKHMGATVQAAVSAAHGQLESVFQHYRVNGSSRNVWDHMGVTVMIGQNDSAGENFSVVDARSLVDFVRSHHVRRVSMWSLNRDSRCGSSFAVVGVHSNICSGTDQTSLEFTRTFAGLTGAISAAAWQPSAGQAPPVSDNPRTSPYPVWQPTTPYITGYKVVRQGSIYQAKWYSQGQDPATQVPDPSQTPWQLVGPVSPGDHAPTTTTLPPGTDPAWSPQATYTVGQRVLYQGLPYRSKWYNKASSPGEEATDPSSSPWQPLFTLPGEPAGS